MWKRLDHRCQHTPKSIYAYKNLHFQISITLHPTHQNCFHNNLLNNENFNDINNKNLHNKNVENEDDDDGSDSDAKVDEDDSASSHDEMNTNKSFSDKEI